MADRSLSYCKIFPGFGIARLGNSPDAHFIGPEIPDVVPNPGGSYKDSQGRVKRQAARFRIYAFDEDDQVVDELTLDHEAVADITWTVTLANRKAEWHEFDGAENVAKILRGDPDVSPLRNQAVQGRDRKKLVIGPATAKVAGRDQRSGDLKGQFLDKPQDVYLGSLLTDEAGRLLVLGGRGESATVVVDNPLGHYANNDHWHDDTSDGPISAVITLKSGEKLPVKGHGWVIVAPPHFSPYTQNVATLYDVMVETALEHKLPWPENEFGAPPAEDEPVSFTRDVYPILRRLSLYQWVNDRARRGHSRGKAGDFMTPDVLRILADPGEAQSPQSLHRRIFSRIRTPILHPPVLGSRPPRARELHPASQEAINQANLSFMPPLSGDESDVIHGEPTSWLSLTSHQYHKLAKWKEGDFVNDWPGQPLATPSSFSEIPVPEQPAALTRASLEACQGGGFFPGIEMTSIARFPSLYSEAFRASGSLKAGEITRWMALPWQADFYECVDHWWPAIRPDDVVPLPEYESVLKEFKGEAAEGNLASLLIVRKKWARGLGTTIPDRPGLIDPAKAGVTTAAEYRAFCRRQLDQFQAGFLRVLPRPLEGEITGFYTRRLEEFLARTIAPAGSFHPSPPHEGEDLNAYRQRVRIEVGAFLAAETDLPLPGTDESLAAYASRLSDLAASKASWQGLFDVEWRRRVRHHGKEDLVQSWSRLGFVTSKTAFGETVYVETDREPFDLLPFREYFYLLMNLEDHEEFLPKARQLADEYLQKGWELEPVLRAIPAFEEYGFFAYNEATFQARLEKIYENQRRDAEAYNPASVESEPLFRTPAQVVERIRQLAPFNQLDGSWLERAAHAGPINEVQSALFEIWSDEIGNGDPSQSHANVYSDLLHSAGIYLPPLASRAYADNPDIWDSSFSSPAYQTAIAHFPEAYYPELLGMTLYLEWEAIFLPAIVKLYEYHGYNPLFYRLHVAIDNTVNGHGARARDAVIRYLDHVREESGEREMQEHWRRIWNGYLSFRFVGGGDWQYFFTNPPTPEERVLDLIDRKRHYAQLNHGVRRFGPNLINDWFDEPGDFLSELISSDLITKGDAKNSRFFKLLSFNGPMLKVFSAKDQAALADWINSLPADPVANSLDAGQAMVVLVQELTSRATGVPDHQGFLLTGKYFEPESQQEVEVTKPVSWWFEIKQPRRLMATLSDPKNGWIVPGNVADSRFVRELVNEPRRMARFLIEDLPELGNKPARQVILEWIEQGCPIPAEAPPKMTLAIPFTANVRPAGTEPVFHQVDEFAREIEGRTESAVPLTPEQRQGLRRRFYGPGGGAPH